MREIIFHSAAPFGKDFKGVFTYSVRSEIVARVAEMVLDSCVYHHGSQMMKNMGVGIAFNSCGKAEVRICV